jgi:hypothetical protein
MKQIAITLLGGLLLGAVDVAAQSRTITAATCGATDVQTAMNQAAAGDTVAIPAGQCSWSTPVYWSAPPNVTLQGAGTSAVGGGDVTVITDNYANRQPLLRITTDNTGTFRMTGFTIKGGTGQMKDLGLVSVSGQSKQVRIDHMHLNLKTYSPMNNGKALRFTGWINGVVDHSILSAFNGIDVWYDGYAGGGVEGDGAWATATGLGGSDYIFVEDSVFGWVNEYAAANDCSHGGKFVLRNNTMNWVSVQTHPTGGAGRARGCRAWEVYDNDFTSPPVNDKTQFNALFLSSGTGVVWGNSVPTGYKNFVTLHSMRKDNKTYPEATTPNGWGYCGTAFNGILSNWDGNNDALTGYPCLDQPGRGAGDLLTGSFPNVKNQSTGCLALLPCAWPRQALEPMYEWDNDFTPAPNWGGSFMVAYETTVLAKNRDYYLQASPFTGATGTGSGLRANRPTTCTTNVAYWATDEETLYRCGANNAWTVYYRPHPYPHPLTLGTQQMSKAPANVRFF